MKIIIPLIILWLTFFTQNANADTASAAANLGISQHDLEMSMRRQGMSVAEISAMRGSSAVVNATTPTAIGVVEKATGSTVATLEATVKSAPLISPSAVKIASTLARGANTAMLVVSLAELVGKAVDYTLDPANNRVKYQIPTDPNGDYVTNFVGNHFTSLSSACADVYANAGRSPKDMACILDNTTIKLTDISNHNISYGDYGYYTGGFGYQSLDTLAQKAKDMADNGDPTAQAGVRSVVQDMITNNEIGDDVYNQNITNDNSNDVVNNYITNTYPNASVGGSKTDNGDGTSTSVNTVTKDNGNGTSTKTTTTTTTNNATNNITNITITNNTYKNDTATSSVAQTFTPLTSAPASTKTADLPAFCDWAGVVCDFITWVKTDVPDPQDDPIDIKNKEKPDFDLPNLSYQPYIQFPANCPNPPTFVVFGQTFAFPIEIFCKFCDEFSYVILAFAWLRALLIVGSGFKGQ